MIKIKQAIIVEGKYDKIKLDSIVDAIIITTNGFEIFKEPKKMELIRRLSMKDGIVIMTDSDVAGFKIRSYIAGSIKDGKIYHAYIPDILGKESRKKEYSKEGKIGVEGIPSCLIAEALDRAGISYEDFDGNAEKVPFITKYKLFEDGISGGKDSARLRSELLKELGLPERLSVNSLLKVINSGMSAEEYQSALEQARKSVARLHKTADSGL